MLKETAITFGKHLFIQVGIAIATIVATASAVLLVINSQNSRLDDIARTVGVLDARINSNDDRQDSKIDKIDNKLTEVRLDLQNLNNSVDDISEDVIAIRKDLGNAVEALGESIERINPTAAKPLAIWEKSYLAKLSIEEIYQSSNGADESLNAPIGSGSLRKFSLMFQNDLSEAEENLFKADIWKNLSSSDAKLLSGEEVLLYSDDRAFMFRGKSKSHHLKV
ncbi:hypothetical protein [Parasulfitobacter algicola]|uniref:Uncharacterized protein n=1 Tax=Parasulfitobacter algicola TaxID=2614809 RepID=A0ABX2IU48_9RHOB|nr:hypothetical protein [Sulfitobacter algicola]NSX56442.1 hypothetical protein [Sulfitobacter algicola]